MKEEVTVNNLRMGPELGKMFLVGILVSGTIGFFLLTVYTFVNMRTWTLGVTFWLVGFLAFAGASIRVAFRRPAGDPEFSDAPSAADDVGASVVMAEEPVLDPPEAVITAPPLEEQPEKPEQPAVGEESQPAELPTTVTPEPTVALDLNVSAAESPTAVSTGETNQTAPAGEQAEKETEMTGAGQEPQEPQFQSAFPAALSSTGAALDIEFDLILRVRDKMNESATEDDIRVRLLVLDLEARLQKILNQIAAEEQRFHELPGAFKVLQELEAELSAAPFGSDESRLLKSKADAVRRWIPGHHKVVQAVLKHLETPPSQRCLEGDNTLKALQEAGGDWVFRNLLDKEDTPQARWLVKASYDALVAEYRFWAASFSSVHQAGWMALISQAMKRF